MLKIYLVFYILLELAPENASIAKNIEINNNTK
jgi:hypothetical protein